MPIFKIPILGSIIKSAIDIRSKISLDTYFKAQGYAAQKKTLKRLLRKANITAIGEHFNFSDMLKDKDFVKSFQEKVPIYDYNSIFKKWWYRSINGEPFVAWPGRIKYFALSSGTSEASSKYIPVTNDMLRSIKKTSIRQIFSLAQYDFPNEFFGKGILMLGGSTHLQYNGTYYEGDLSGITAGNIPFWFQHFYKPGRRISKERDWPTKLEELIKNAPNWDIGVICGVPAWIQILLERIIERYKLKNIHEIWPNFSIYVHGGVSITPYYKGFEKLLGKPITFIETYLASEGFVAYQSRPKTSSMQLVLDNGMFFEFVPFTDENFDSESNIRPNAKAITLKDVKENTEYALLLSTNAGAWRYLIGDTIKFTSVERCEIIITGRTKHFLSLCGEHLSQDNMNRAIHMLEEEFNIEVPEFSVAGIKHNSMFAHKWYIGTDNQIDPIIVQRKIDEYLKVLNDDYRVERIAAITEVFAEVLPVQVFYNWLKTKGKEGGQNKFPRVLKNEKLNDWEEFLKGYKATSN